MFAAGRLLRLGIAAALAGRPDRLAAACRAAVEALEPTDREARPPRATCDAPNCAGHRVRA